MPKISISGVCNRAASDIERCRDRNKGLWLPWLTPPQEGTLRPLAILGGGPSINEHVAELKEWPGDIWAINGSFRWCKERGIRSTFFTLDPETYEHTSHPTFEWLEKGDPVIVSPRVPEIVVDHAMWVEADVRLFDLAIGGVTAATWALKLSAIMGRGNVTLYGAEGSYREGEASHAYENCVVHDRILVESNGERFLTKFELLHQGIWLSEELRAFPKYYKEKSGGLLRALVVSGDYDILKVPRWFRDGCTLVDNGTTPGLWKWARETLVGCRKRGLGPPGHA